MSNNLSTDLVRTVDLDHEQLLIFENRPGTRFQVLSGGLWLTEEACRDDRFARSGEALKLERRGRAVLEALGRSRVQVIAPAQRAGDGLRQLLRRWAPRLETFAARSVAVLLALALGLGLPEWLGRSLFGATGAAPAQVAAISQVPAATMANRA
jgi:hypothetical protein